MEEVKKQGLESLFVGYNEALALKELGFDEPCFGYWQGGANIEPTMMCNQGTIYVSDYNTFKNTFPNGESRWMTVISPLYQQAFRWFREKHNLQAEMVFSEKPDRFYYYIGNMVTGDMDRGINMSYEEAESSCLYKLIEIVKNK